jgi:hypothetical protein
MRRSDAEHNTSNLTRRFSPPVLSAYLGPSREAAFSTFVLHRKEKASPPLRCWPADRKGQLNFTNVSSIFFSSSKHTGRKSHHAHHMPGRL